MAALFIWKQKKQPVIGDERIVKKFLLFPKFLDNQWRWLGFERIQQIYSRHFFQPIPEMSLELCWTTKWKNAHWVDPVDPCLNPVYWISVEDRLPEAGQDIVGINDKMYNIEDMRGYWFERFDGGEPLGNMTHWYPVPKFEENIDGKENKTS